MPIFFFCNAFLSIFTVCLLRPINLYPHHLDNEKKEKEKEDDLKSS